jgi:WhiB family transcriptional regulator, redox-sensing transcriptional regulator
VTIQLDLAYVLPRSGTVRERRASDAATGQAAFDSNKETAAMDMDSAASADDTATAWMAAGNCRLYPPATFFPSDGVGVEKARKICAGCPVTTQCLDYALEHRIDHGVWGGCSERERRRILKRRRLETAAS